MTEISTAMPPNAPWEWSNVARLYPQIPLQGTKPLSTHYHAIIVALGTALGTKAPWQANVDKISEIIYRELPALNWAGLFFIQEHKGPLVCRASRGGDGLHFIPWGQGICGTAVKKGQQRIVADVRKCLEYLSANPPGRYPPTRSELAQPLRDGKRVVGVLNLESPVPGHFGKEDKIGCTEIAAWLERWQRQYGNAFPPPSIKVNSERSLQHADFNGIKESNLQQNDRVNNAKNPPHEQHVADYGLDAEEIHLALMAAAAGKEVAEQLTTAAPDELRRLRDMRRLWDLRLDLYQKSKAALKLPEVLSTPEQYKMATGLATTCNDVRKLEFTMFGKDRVSEKSSLVTEIQRRASNYARDKKRGGLPPRPYTRRRTLAA
ncbi:MAG: GAF domain-containing protein [Acidisphaera sp.]|nr:GAF domain-containing protein [Acidisphaera sp.]